METRTFKVPYAYSKEIIPPRCRKPRMVDGLKDTAKVEVRFIPEGDPRPKIAFVVHGGYPRVRGGRKIYACDGKLWALRMASKDCAGAEGPEKATELERIFAFVAQYGGTRSKERRLTDLKGKADSLLIVGNYLYEQVNEPRYCIYTFGLGHNHAGIGTDLSVDFHYNDNICKDRYFNALHKAGAIRRAKEIALGRGDTDSVKYIGKEYIEVRMPELVKCNPAAEAGEGCAFTNGLEALIGGSNSALDAGLLVMVAAGTAAKE